MESCYDWSGPTDEEGLPIGIVSKLADVARCFRRSYHTVKAWGHSGMPIRSDGKYDLRKIALWKRSRKGDSQRHRADGNDSGSATETLRDLRTAQVRHLNQRVITVERQIADIDDRYVDRKCVVSFFDGLLATIGELMDELVVDVKRELGPEVGGQVAQRLRLYERGLRSHRAKLVDLKPAKRRLH